MLFRRTSPSISAAAALKGIAVGAIAIAFTATGCGREVKPSIPAVNQIALCETDALPAHAHDLAGSVADGCRDLIAFLTDAHAVSAHRWRHGYSHVAMQDRSGRIVLRDGRTFRWMLRPGGLGYLENARGKRSYLVSCKC